MKKAPETYADYLKRVSGFADFTPLTKEAWEKDTNPGTASLPEVGNWGGTKIDPFPGKLQTPNVVPPPQTVMSQFVPANQPNDPAGSDLADLIEGSIAPEDLPEGIQPTIVEVSPTTIMLDHLPEGSH